MNQNCASGMRALQIVCDDILLGKTDIGLAVGVESMTNAPYLLPKGRNGYRMGPGTIEDSMLHDGLVDELSGGHMGVTAENVAKRYNITREECDDAGPDEPSARLCRHRGRGSSRMRSSL